MYIDLHCHTKKCKHGDPTSRDVTRDRFIEKVNCAHVGAVAITNHNTFDLEQFNLFKNDDFLVWPGVELDVIGVNGNEGHCIVIVSPLEVDCFDKQIKAMTAGFNPDEYKISLKDLCDFADCFNSIVMCHYGKDHSLTEDTIRELKKNLGKTPLYLEPSNLVAVGIFLAHNLDSLIGSDVKDWDVYEKYSFPELKVDIDTYEHFLLLIKKDKEIIKTFVDKKKKDAFDITPFEDKTQKISIQLYNDTNVIIGGKASGKTKILQSIQQHYESIQNDSVSAYYASDKSAKYKDIIKFDLGDEDYEVFGVSKYEKELKAIEDWKVPAIEKTSNYYSWICNKKEVKNFGFSNASFNDQISKEKYDNELTKYINNKKHLDAVCQTELNLYLTEEENNQFLELVNKLIERQKKKVVFEFNVFHSLKLKEFTINKMKDLYLLKKGKNSKPNNCGLLNLYSKSKELFETVNSVIETIKTQSKYRYKLIGKIEGKGYVFVRKYITLNPNESKLEFDNGIKTNQLKAILDCLENIRCNFTSPKLVQHVSNFSSLKKSNEFTSLTKFMRSKNDVVLCDVSNPDENSNVEKHDPSNGEQSMLILNNSLYQENKDIFILDEPEMSVGHDYINSSIVPRIIELSKLNKTVIVATHDANIAVRTLPFTTIYRCGDKQKKTYVGNPFHSEMVNIDDQSDRIPWAQTCIDTLEGGSVAFRERGESYGKENL